MKYSNVGQASLLYTRHGFGTRVNIQNAFSGPNNSLPQRSITNRSPELAQVLVNRFVGGELKRSKKAVTIRGLNKNHNHDLKNIFKGAATRAASTAGPFREFYEARLASGMKPPMARLTLARKIAAITLLVWKKGVRFDAEQLKQQAA